MLGHRAYTEQVHWAARSATGANESFMINEHYEALGLVGDGGLGLGYEPPCELVRASSLHRAGPLGGAPRRESQ